MTDIFREGNVLFARSFAFDAGLFRYAQQSIDPSTVKIPDRSIPLYFPTTGAPAVFLDLMEIDANKIGDLLIVDALPDGEKARVMRPFTINADPTQAEKDRSRYRKMNQAGGILYAYLLHGSLGRLARADGRVPEYVLKGTALTNADFSLTVLSSLDSFTQVKFKAAVDALIGEIRNFPESTQSRLMLGFAGNRIFSVARMLKTVPGLKVPTSEVIAHIMDQETQLNAPYCTFHPDHPFNPMGQHAKRVWADLGALIDHDAAKIESLRVRSPGLFTGPIVDSLKKRSEDTGEDLPDFAEFAVAAGYEFSLPKIIRG